MKFDGYLTMSEVAELRGTHRTSAFRWVQRHAAKHIQYIGRYPVISATTYRRIALADRIEDKLLKVESRLNELEDDTSDLTQRVDAMARRTGS